jgi:hypothetical protein
MRLSVWCGLALGLLISAAAHAGTITATYSLTAGSGKWNTAQSSNLPISLGSGIAVVQFDAAGLYTPTGTAATLVSLYATGQGPSLSAHALQVNQLYAQLVTFGATGFTASAAVGTIAGFAQGPSGLFPLNSAAAAVWSGSKFQLPPGSAQFKLAAATFLGATTAVVTQAFLGQEVSRSFVPEPSSFSLVLLGLAGLAVWPRFLSART